MAIFERFVNSLGVFDKVRLSSQEFSLLRGASSAPRSSRNHITSRKELDLLLSFGLISRTCCMAWKRDLMDPSTHLFRISCGHTVMVPTSARASPEARAGRRDSLKSKR